MTKGEQWVQGLVDKHLGKILNTINELPLNYHDRTILEIEAKQLLMAVASDVMHEIRDECFASFKNAIGVMSK